MFPDFHGSKTNGLTPKNFLKIVVTGPESTGKTELAETLARLLGTRYVPEFARYYVAHLGRPYERGDLIRIARGQKNWETWYAGQLNGPGPERLLVCDTDWTVLQIWEQYRFRPADGYRWPQGYGAADNADLYFLCAPDFPWQPDALREHPEEREQLFELYRQLLSDRQARFNVLTGDRQTRLKTALAVIRELLRPLQ